ncbi:MAG: MATE family efflux transporter [Candidatus Omnitrophota bacterium]
MSLFCEPKKDKPAMGGIKEMLTIALPMVVSHACYTIMIFTDRLFLSRLGSEEMNAAMGGGLTSFMMMTFFIGLIGYSTAVTAQYFGAGQKRQCPVVAAQAGIIAIIAYPLIIIFKPLGYFLFDLMKINPVQAGLQRIYFNILLYGSVVGLFRCCLSGFFTAIGRTKIVMTASFTAMAVNVLVSYTLIFGKFGFPALGIRGAAYGTIIGGISGLFMMLFRYFSKGNRFEYGVNQSFHFNKEVMGTLLRFGYPAGLEMFLNILAFNIVVMMFHSLGLVTATAVTIAFNWDMVSFIPLIGVEIGVTSLIGRYLGARRPDIAQRSVISGLKLGMIYSSLILIFFLGFPSFLVNIFRPSVLNDIFIKALPTAVFMVRFASLYVLVEAIMIVFIGTLRGAGDSFWAMFLSVSLHWILVPILFVMLKVWRLSAEAGWVAMILVFFVFSFLIYLRYRSGKWKDIKMIHPQPEPVVVVHSGFPESPDL